MTRPAILCYIPLSLVLPDMEEQIETFASLSSLIKSQTVFPFLHIPNYTCHLIFSRLSSLNHFLGNRHVTSLKRHAVRVVNDLLGV